MGVVCEFRVNSISQIPRVECIRQISHNAPLCDRNVHTCAHFCYKVVRCGIRDWHIVGLWDGSIRTITMFHGISGYSERCYNALTCWSVNACTFTADFSAGSGTNLTSSPKRSDVMWAVSCWKKIISRCKWPHGRLIIVMAILNEANIVFILNRATVIYCVCLTCVSNGKHCSSIFSVNFPAMMVFSVIKTRPCGIFVTSCHTLCLDGTPCILSMVNLGFQYLVASTSIKSCCQ